MTATVIVLGFISGLTFALLIAEVALLLTLPRPRLLLAAAWVGGFTASTLGGLVTLHLFRSFNDILGTTQRHGSTDFEVVVGAVALVIGVIALAPVTHRSLVRAQARRKRAAAAKPESRLMRRLRRGSIGITLVGTAAMCTLPGPLYLSVLARLAASDESSVAKLLHVLLFNVAEFAVLEVPLLGYLVNEDATDHALAALSRVLRRHGLTIVGVALVAIGAFYVIRGLVAP